MQARNACKRKGQKTVFLVSCKGEGQNKDDSFQHLLAGKLTAI